MADVDPFVQPIPQRFQSDRELRNYYEYLHRWLHDMWVRTGGGDDAVETANVEEKYAWELAPKPEESVSDIQFPRQSEVDRFNAVTVTSRYTLEDFDFVNAKSRGRLTLPKYPKENSVVIIRNGDGSEISINGNGRNINGESSAKIRRKGTALTLQYFIDDNEWFAR